jgi:RES domain-containing protein
MEYPRALVDQLSALPATAWSGDVFRWTFTGTPPDRANTRGARWNPPGVPALYTSFARDIILAESDYLIQAQGIPPNRVREIHTFSLSLKSVLDLSDRALLRRLGIDDAALQDTDYSRCQMVGGAVERLRNDGLIVPLARGQGNNLVIFVNHIPFSEPLAPVKTERVKPGGAA